MNIPVLTFFNNKGGVGKTSLVYHLAWMFADLGKRVVAIDLDPQANLTSAFLAEDELETLWNDNAKLGDTIYSCMRPLLRTGDILPPILREVSTGLCLVPGDLGLASVEDALSGEWPKSMGSTELYRPFRVLSAFWQIAQMAGDSFRADIVIVDVGPNLGAINRSALIASDWIAIPVGADLFSLQGLRNLGPTLKTWREEWSKRIANWSQPEFTLPKGTMKPIGYIMQQHGVRLSRPVKAYDTWVNRMPLEYRTSILEEINAPNPSIKDDPYCLAMLKHYRSLVPMGQEARKPIFKLTPADGAIGAHNQAVQDAYEDFRKLAVKLLTKMKLRIPSNIASSGV